VVSVDDLVDGDEVLVMPSRKPSRQQLSSQLHQQQHQDQARLPPASSPLRQAAPSQPVALPRQPQRSTSPERVASSGEDGGSFTAGELQLREFLFLGASAANGPRGNAGRRQGSGQSGQRSSSPPRGASPLRSAGGFGGFGGTAGVGEDGDEAPQPEARAWDSSSKKDVVRPSVMMRPWQRKKGRRGPSGASAAAAAAGSAGLRAARFNAGEGSGLFDPPPVGMPPSPTTATATATTRPLPRSRSPSPGRLQLQRPSTAGRCGDWVVPGGSGPNPRPRPATSSMSALSSSLPLSPLSTTGISPSSGYDGYGAPSCSEQYPP